VKLPVEGVVDSPISKTISVSSCAAPAGKRSPALRQRRRQTSAVQGR
jgi:hypothetical protein